MKIVNPATEEQIADLPEDNKTTLDRKMTLLRAAQPSWQKIPVGDRTRVLSRFCELLKENIEELAGILTAEVGKPLQQSRNEVNGAITKMKWPIDHAVKYLADEIMNTGPGLEERIAYEPLGVICNISAWNYPYLVGVNAFVPALLAGNTVMYKPSEYSTLTGLQIEKYLKLAGLPADAFQVAVGAREVGEYLLDMPFNGYFFTGSYKTGKYIYEKVASKMVPCVCELGGKDPVYITDDVADIKSAAAATADGAFYNNGQSCCAVERIYVHESVYDEYSREFIKEVKSWKVGAPGEAGVYIGPVTRREQPAFLESQVKDAVQKGATLMTGGKTIPGKGYYFEPTVLTEVNHGMAVMKDESFGPIIGIMKVKDDEEAIGLMKDSEYGLTAAVYGRDQSRAEQILREVNAGTGYWNCCDRVSAALPWSGRGHSGIGSSLSHSGLRAFTKPKAYHLKS